MSKKLAFSVLLAAGLLAGPAAGEDARKPSPFTLIFVERFRFEAWDNAVNLDDAAADSFAYTRNRTTLGVVWKPLRNLEVLGKFTNEFRVYLAPKTQAFSWNEIFFDNLYVKWTVPGRMPFVITAGRQDINFGEGFVIADGTPLDGSRSYYFNAVRLDADLAKGHRLTAFLHAQDTTDTFLPVINEAVVNGVPVPRPLAEQPEWALAFYYAGSLGRAKVDAYAVRKTADATTLFPVPARIDTFGARAVVPLSKPLALTAEAALQTGSYGDAGRSAYGAIAQLDYDLKGKVPLLKSAGLGGILLSGDDPATAGMEGWDPIYSRWPKWSESFVYTLTRERGQAFWSNLVTPVASLTFDFGARSDALLSVAPMWAPQPQPGDFPGGAGHRRGTLIKGRLNYTISKFLSGRFIWEHFSPGDFYFDGASSYDWMQFEMILRY